MPLKRADAVNEMVAVVAPALDGIPTVYPNKSEAGIDKSGVWARVVFRHAESGKATLGGKLRRERHSGFLFVQFLMPLGKGSDDIYTAPQPLLDAITDCGTPGGVWFRDVSLFEGSNGAELDTEEDGAYFTAVFQAQFTYDEIRT